jgi:acyl-CoA thioesterase FadM
MNRQYSLPHTVRYDECNCDDALTPTSVLRYMQEIAGRDAEDTQLGGTGYWVVKRTIITFTAPVSVHTQLELKTYGIHFTRITALRGYDMYMIGADKPLISARTLWVYVDAHGRPMRLPENTARIWLPDGSLPHSPETPLPAVPETTPETTETTVQFSDIDSMRHLNNAAAVEMLDNASWQAYAESGISPDTTRLDVLSYDIEYVSSPRFGNRLAVQSWLEPLIETGQEHTRLQQITHDEKVMVRAFSRWVYKDK